MKRLLMAAIFLLFSTPVMAGVSYDFVSETTGGSEDQRLAGKATVDGQNLRVDLDEGDGTFFDDGTTVISTDGGSTLFLIDHKKKSWFELPLEKIFNSFETMMKSMGGMFDIKVSNHKSSVNPGGSGGSIEGYETSRYTVKSSYDFAIKVMGMNMNGSVDSQSEVWSTDKLSSEYTTFVQQRGFKTGMEGVDEVLQAQMDSMKGFPLKIVSRNKTTVRGRTQESTTNMSVSNIEEGAVPASKFEIPDGYSQTEAPVMELPGMQRR